MIAITKKPHRTLTDQERRLFASFIPRIKQHAEISFQSLRLQDREEAVAEVIAIAFAAFQSLAERGRLAVAYASPLARFGVARFRSGRRAAGTPSQNDVFCSGAQHRAGFSVESMHSPGARSAKWGEMLTDDHVTPIPDQVAFKIDFGDWLASRTRRDRQLVDYLAVGNTPAETADEFGLSRGRISQLRRRWEESWQALQREPPIRNR